VTSDLVVLFNLRTIVERHIPAAKVHDFSLGVQVLGEECSSATHKNIEMKRKAVFYLFR
jgi:hypothetical protein